MRPGSFSPVPHIEIYPNTSTELSFDYNQKIPLGGKRIWRY
jgi:hypothetical protein